MEGQYIELTYIVRSFRLPQETNEQLVNRVVNDFNLLHACASVCGNLNCNTAMVKMILQTPQFIINL